MMMYMKGGSKDLDFLISIKKYSREIMGLSQCKDLKVYGNTNQKEKRNYRVWTK